MINWKEIEAHWRDFQPKFRTKWNKLTATDIEGVKGKREELVRLISERYGVTRPEATKQVDEFLKTLKPLAAK